MILIKEYKKESRSNAFVKAMSKSKDMTMYLPEYINKAFHSYDYSKAKKFDAIQYLLVGTIFLLAAILGVIFIMNSIEKFIGIGVLLLFSILLLYIGFRIWFYVKIRKLKLSRNHHRK